ncbi:hypothetical protein B566_EDAN009011 [Ephemera danica]|nr:hypothetical protein B566_EDAN009011 [Ephemera danica]
MIATTGESAVGDKGDVADQPKVSDISAATAETSNMTIAKATSGSNVMGFVYNFAKKLGTTMAIYMLGYFNFSAAWLLGPLLICVMREEWKRESEMKREVAKASALCNEKDVVLARVCDLPSWVFFPDVERAEWLNRIMKILWPNVNHYVRELLKDVIEPNLQASMAPYKMGDFKFERIILGSIPPRIGGVKVYDRNVSRSEIIMDLDVFYAGDCDITFSVKGMKGGIKDFQIHGLLRVVMRPLITKIPLVGGLQVFFLNNPDVDFNLVGVVDVFDLPGLRDILHRIIIEQVAAMMVLPNKLPIALSEDVPAQVLRTPEPEGVLRVHLVEAKDLMKMDIGMLGKGKSDPYAVISVGAQTFKSKIIMNTVNPKWDFWSEMLVDTYGQTLHIVLYDDDDPKKDDFLGRSADIKSLSAEISSRKAQELLIEVWDWDPGFPGYMNDDYLGSLTRCAGFCFGAAQFVIQAGHVLGLARVMIFDKDPGQDDKLGRATIDINSICQKGETDMWVTLEDAKTGKALAETQLLRLTEMSSSLFMIYVDSCKNLPNARPTSKPDPFVVLSLGSKQEQTSAVMRTGDPVWEQGFTFLVHNPEADTLTLKVMDQKTSQEIGRFVYNLVDLMEKKLMELQSQPYQLKQSESGVQKQSSRESLHSLPGLPEAPDSPAKKTSGVEELMTSVANNATLEALPGMELRRRGTSSPPVDAGENDLGVIQLTLRYSVARQRLVVVVHKIVNLPLKDPTNIPDPYVKLHLLPERSRESKRKTEMIKDNCNPVYDESFEYIISEGELAGRELEVSVVTRKGFFSSSPLMGQVIINLSELDLNQGTTRWFDLCPQKSRDN